MGRMRLFVLNSPEAPRLSPDLAREIGLNESILLLQLEYWISISNAPEIDGRRWTYQSLRAIQKFFPFWSKDTISRALDNLRERGLIVVARHNKYGYDRTQWFAIDLEAANKLESVNVAMSQFETGVSQNETGVSQIETVKPQNETPKPQNETTIPESTRDFTETTTEKKKKAVSARGRTSRAKLAEAGIDVGFLERVLGVYSKGWVTNELQAVTVESLRLEYGEQAVLEAAEYKAKQTGRWDVAALERNLERMHPRGKKNGSAKRNAGPAEDYTGRSIDEFIEARV